MAVGGASTDGEVVGAASVPPHPTRRDNRRVPKDSPATLMRAVLDVIKTFNGGLSSRVEYRHVRCCLETMFFALQSVGYGLEYAIIGGQHQS